MGSGAQPLGVPKFSVLPHFTAPDPITGAVPISAMSPSPVQLVTGVTTPEVTLDQAHSWLCGTVTKQPQGHAHPSPAWR